MQKPLTTSIEDFVDPKQLESAIEFVLQQAKQLGATAAEVGTVASLGLNVTARLGDVETVTFNRDKGISITVYQGQQKGTASTTDISTPALTSAVQTAIAIAQVAEADPASGLADATQLADTAHLPALDLYHPWALSVPDAITQAVAMEAVALKADPRITNSDGATVSTQQRYQLYGNSHGFLGGYATSRHSLSCVMIGETEQGMERSYDYSVHRKPTGLQAPEAIGQSAAQKTVQKLGGRHLKTQKAPVIFHAQVASSLWGHLISAISGGRLYRQTSFLLNQLGQQILPTFIDIEEQPHLPGRLGSAPYDSDGLLTRQKSIITAGELATYLLGTYSARKLGMTSTANAGGAHNVMVKPTMGDLPALLSQMQRGLLVTELMGQGVNLTTGDYSRGVNGYWVENGEIQYPVHEVTIAGQLSTMFESILGVGNDLDERGNIVTGSVWINEMAIAGQ